MIDLAKEAELRQNSHHVFPYRWSNDSEEARRSWRGIEDKEEGNRDLWAFIQEPYSYIMGRSLIANSYQVLKPSKIHHLL